MNQPPVITPPPTTPDTRGSQPAMVAYLIYLVACFTAVPSLVAVVVAYIFRDGAPDWLQTHYQYLIRTFWLMCLYIVIGIILWIFLIGMLVLALVPFWMGARCIVGIRALNEGRPISNPTSWII